MGRRGDGVTGGTAGRGLTPGVDDSSGSGTEFNVLSYNNMTDAD